MSRWSRVSIALRRDGFNSAPHQPIYRAWVLLILAFTSFGSGKAEAAESDTPSAAQAEALGLPAFNAPIRLLIGPDASSAIPKIEAMKGRVGEPSGFSQNIVLYLPDPCVLDYGISTFEARFYAPPVAATTGKMDIRLDGLNGTPRPALDNWVLGNNLIKLRQFDIVNVGAGGHDAHTFTCPLIDTQLIEKIKLSAPQSVAQGSQNGVNLVIGKRVFEAWTYSNSYTTPLPQKGDVKVFAGTFSYKIEPAVPSVLGFSSNGLGIWRVKMYYDPDRGNWTTLESEKTDPSISLISNGSPTILRSESKPPTLVEHAPPAAIEHPVKKPDTELKTEAEIQTYCRQVGNTESSGEGTLYPAQFPTAWRCVNSSVYTCELGASGRACMKMSNSRAPTQSVRDYCRRYPNTDVPNAANGTPFTWSCRGTNPVITGGAPVDERGYFKESWHKVSAVTAPNASPETASSLTKPFVHPCRMGSCYSVYLVSSTPGRPANTTVARLKFEYDARSSSAPPSAERVFFATYSVSCKRPGGYVKGEDGPPIPQPNPQPVHASEEPDALWKLLCSAGASSTGKEEPEIREFLATLYSHGRPARPAIFDKEMLSVLAENKRLLKGDLGALDYDPFCQCQDDEGMRPNVTGIQVTDPSDASASLDLRWQGGQKVFVRFDLKKADGRWRIHDVMSKRVPSLLKQLIEENRKLASASAAGR